MQRLLIVAIFLAGVCGCSKSSEPSPTADDLLKRPDITANVEAGKFLRDLQNKGKLPGLSRDDHGKLEGRVSSSSAAAHFPMSGTFEYTKDNDFIYHYTVERVSEASDWRLVKAWQTDAAGKQMREFSIP